MQWLKKYRWFILAFFIPFLIYSLFFLWQGCFTDRVILKSDMWAQYLPLFQYLKDVLHGDASFPYSFSNGYGGGMYGSFFYYLSNPLNALVYFFSDVSLFLTLLVILKLSLSGLTMYMLLFHQFKKHSIGMLIFSLAYALMGYNINYYVNLMWLDGVVLAPIIVIGIDKIVHHQKSYLYAITLFVSICLNYYIGYMLTLFSVLYFCYSIYLNCDHIKNEKKLIGHFFLVTALVGFMTSFILIPCGLELLNTLRITSFEGNGLIRYNFFDYFASNYIGFGSLHNPLNFYGFLLFSGSCIVPLIFQYFFSCKVSSKEKRATFFMYLCFLLPITFPLFNMVWHMFSIPSGFNYRYSFLFVLFSLLIAYRSFLKLEISTKACFLYFILFSIFSICLGYVSSLNSEYYLYLTPFNIIVTFLFLIFYLWLLIKDKKKYIVWVLLVELICNLGWIGYDSKLPTYKEYQNMITAVEDLASHCDERYRCDSVMLYFGWNSSLYGDYSSGSAFLSTTNQNIISFYLRATDHELGQNFYKYRFDLITDMLLGFQTIQLKKDIPFYELIEQQEVAGTSLYTYHNSNALQRGYLVSRGVKEFTSERSGCFYLEDILNQMADSEESYILSLPVTKISEKQYVLSKEQTYPYLYIWSDFEPKVNGKSIQDYIYMGEHYGVIYDEYGDTLTFTFEEDVDSFSVYTIDVEKIKAFRESRVELEITEEMGNQVVGSIVVEQPSTLMLTIPYEKGFEVYVDGEKASYYPVLESFIGIDLSPGEHVVTLQYHVYGLRLGLWISLISFLGLLIFYKKSDKLTKKL